jgi:RNA polymerase sigma-70 factor (ECF subfamily)
LPSLDQLYRSYGPAIYARCRRILGDPAAAEDATQEAFMKVHRHLSEAPSSEEALRWIYRIATNHCLNELRNSRTRAKLLEDQGTQLTEAVLTEGRIFDQDLGRRVVMHAPEKVRAAAWLHYVDGLDQGEVATVLGISRRSVVNYLQTFLEHARAFAQRSLS